MEILNNLNNSELSNNKKLNKVSTVKNNTQTLPKEGIIKGEVVDVKGLAVKILASSGQYISGKMTEANILKMGEQKVFEVFNENGQTKMKPLSLSSDQNKLLQIKKALSELGIVNNAVDEAIAKELMNNELPVNEKMLKDLGRLLKLFNSGETSQNNNNTNTTNINSSNNTDTTTNLKQANTEKTTEVSEKNNSLLSSKNVDKGVFVLKNEIAVNLKNAKLVTQFANKNVNIQSDLSNIADDINNIKDTELKQTLQNIVNFNDENGVTEKNAFSKANVGNLQSILKNIISSSTQTNTQQSVKSNVEQQLLNLLGDKINNNPSGKVTIQNLLQLPKDELKEIFKDVNKSELVKIIKDNIKNTDFSFKLNSGTLEEVDDFFQETTTKFEKLLQQLQTKDDDASKELFNKLVDTKDKMDFGNHIKNNVFLQLPLNINNHKTNGELTIFKDKRKKGCKDVSSALISLDTKSLGIFETFVQKQNNNLNLQFRLENKNVEALVKKHLNDLKSTLNSLRYNIENISFKTAEQSFSIITAEKDLKQLELNVSSNNTTFDAKA